MSGQAVISGAAPGFYGKFPVRGDFVTRNLPMDFIRPWDEWLQSAVAASREQLGESWLQTYLTSPLWRFVLSAGLCGSRRWAGVVMPSVDRVGRYFPLTIVAAVDPCAGLPDLLCSAGGWFERIEEIALTALDNDFELDQFEAALARLQFPVPEADPDEAHPVDHKTRGAAGRTAFQVGVADSGDIPAGFARLSAMLFEKYIPSYSLWNSEGSDQVAGSLVACEGLPPVDAFSSFLNGGWLKHGWNVRTGQAQVFEKSRNPNADNDTLPPIEYRRFSDRAPVSELPSHNLRWASYGETNVGLKREINEDALLVNPELGLWIVADGMGGHHAGDLASKMAVAAFDEIQLSDDIAEAVSQVCVQIQQINRILYLFATEALDGQVIGTTLVALVGRGNRCGLIWAGDSRIYRLRRGEILQLTRDHAADEDETEAADRNIQGYAPESRERSNVITRAVGAEEYLELDRQIIDVDEGDLFVLCSDGLIKEVSPVEIENALSTGTPRECVSRLLDLALDRDARDNVTVIVVQANAG